MEGELCSCSHIPAGWTWRTRLLRARNEIPPWTKQRERSSCQRGQRPNLHGQAMLSVSFHPAAWASLAKLGTWHSVCDVFNYKANTWGTHSEMQRAGYRCVAFQPDRNEKCPKEFNFSRFGLYRNTRKEHLNLSFLDKIRWHYSSV